MAGPHLPRYEILEELGHGGMSVVYRARDREVPRLVAVKVLHEFLAKQPDARRRFHQEALAVTRLHHPGIVEIFDASQPNQDEAYLVTELIEGPTLRELVEREGHPPHPEIGMLLVAQLAPALQHAHQNGIVHRDLKPENIMVTKEGSLKLMDFGIAQIQDVPKMTVTGTLLGSPAHMAPEVLDGERPDARADLFSLGTILYWLTTGRLPFDAPNPTALFRQIIDGRFEDPQELEPRIGNGLAKILRRLLSRDREARYQSAAELQADLERELDSVGLLPVETSTRRYLTDPAGFVAELSPQLTARLIAAGKTALKERNFGRAVDRANRVLALNPNHPEARALARALSDKVGRGRRTKRLIEATLAMFVLAAGAASIGRWRETKDGEEPPSTPKPPGESFAVKAPRASKTATQGARPGQAVIDARVETSTRAPIARAVDPSQALGVAKRPQLEKRRPQPPAGGHDTSSRPADRPDASAAPAVLAELGFRIGRSWANIELDGQVVAQEAYVGRLTLAPGRHRLVVRRPPLGQFRPRTLEVDEHGGITELRGDGTRRPVRGELLFAVPAPEQSDASPDWIPAGSF